MSGSCPEILGRFQLLTARTCTNVHERAPAAAHRAPVPDLLRKCRRECCCGFQGCPLWPVWLCAGKMWPGIVSALCAALCASCALLRSCSRILVRSAARLLLPDLRALDQLEQLPPVPVLPCCRPDPCRASEPSCSRCDLYGRNRCKDPRPLHSCSGSSPEILGRSSSAAAAVALDPVRDQSAELSGIVSAWPSGSAAELLRSSALYL